MKEYFSKIDLSKNDLKRGLNLPREMSESLAEDIGIMIGDGHIGRNKWAGGVEYSVNVSNNSITDKDYIINYVKPLKLKLYNLNFSILYIGKNKTEIRLTLCSKGLVEFYTKVLGLPPNRKKSIRIPDCIWSKRKYVSSCLRGIVDTDFSLCFKKKGYPVLQLATSSDRLVKDCQEAFERFGIKANIYCNIKRVHSVTKRSFITNYLFINGRKNLERYVKKIGFSNKKNIKKWARRDLNSRPPH